MRFFYILFFIFFSTVLNADDYEFVVYTWGDVDSVKNAFNAIAAILNDDSFRENMEYIAILASVLLSARHLLDEDAGKAFAEIAYVIGVMTFVYDGAVDVKINDNRQNMNVDTSSYATVSNVPWLLGFTAHSSSLFVKYMVEEISDAGSPALSSQTYSNLGFLENLNFLKNQLLFPDRLTRADKDFRYVSDYYDECIMKYAINIPDEKFAILSDMNETLQTAIDPDNLNIADETYDEDHTCKEYFDDYNITDALDNIGEKLYDHDYNTTGIKASDTDDDFLEIIDNNDILGSTKQVNINLVGARLFDESSRKNGIGVAGVDMANAVSVESSKRMLLQNGSGQFAWMADMLPKSMHLLTIIILFAYVPMGIVVAFLGMKKGLPVLMNFVFGYIAFQSIHISFAIVQNVLNGYMVTEATSKLYALGGSVASAKHIPAYVQYLSDMTGLAGLLGVASIPLVIGIMYKGEVAAASGIATSVGGAFKSSGIDGAQNALTEYNSTNQAEKTNLNNMSNEELAQKRLRDMGFEPAPSGSAMMHMAEIEAGMEKANKAVASYDAMTSNGGYQALNAGANIRAQQDESNKLGAGRVVVDGGELHAVQLAKIAGDAEGARSMSSVLSEGALLEQENFKHPSDGLQQSTKLARAAGVVDGTKKAAGMIGQGEQALKSGMASENGLSALIGKENIESDIDKTQDEIKKLKSKLADDPDLQKVNYDPTDPDNKKKMEENAKKRKPILDEIAKKEEALRDLQNQHEQLQSLRDFATDSSTKSAADVAASIKSGSELNRGEKNKENFIKAAELKAVQDTNTAIETGATGVEDDFRDVAIDNAKIAAKKISDVNKRRNQLKNAKRDKEGFLLDEDGNRILDEHGKGIKAEKWDADKIAEGQAIQEVQGEIKTQGVFNALSKENNTRKTGDDSSSFLRAAMGSEFSGRKEENDLLGIGKKWESMTGSNKDIKLMAKEQDNAAVSAIGGIESAHKMIERAHGVDGAIDAGNVLADEKAISSLAHKDNLVKKYGHSLNKKDTKTGKKLYDEAQEDLESAENELASTPNDGSLENKRKREVLENRIKSAKDIMKTIGKDGEGMSLSDVSSLVDASKLDSVSGQAVGIAMNKNAGVDYAKNAAFSEMSKQQSTAESIKTFGSIEQAVDADVISAKEKAKTAKKHVENMQEEYGASLDNESLTESNKNNKKIKEAQDKVDKTKDNLSKMKELGINDQQYIAEEERLKKSKEDLEKVKSSVKGKTFEDITGSIDKSKIQSAVGQARGIDKNIEKGVDYAKNAAFSEMSKQQSTQKKIDTQGGVEQAVATDVAEAGLKANKQQQSVKRELQEQIADTLLKSNKDMTQKESHELAGKTAEAIIRGGKVMNEQLSNILGKGVKVDGLKENARVSDIEKLASSNAGNLAGTMSAAKTATDLKTTGLYNNSDDYVQSQVTGALSKEVKAKAKYDFSRSPKRIEEQFSEEFAQAKNANIGNEYIQDSLAYGLLKKDKNGKLHLAQGEEYVKARALAAAGSMDRDDSFVMGGKRFNTSTNVVTGESITNIDGLRKINMGNSTNMHLADPNNANEALVTESADLSMNPKKLISTLAGKTYGGTIDYLTSRGVAKDEAEEFASSLKYDENGKVISGGTSTPAIAAAVVTTGLLTAGVTEAIQRTLNFGKKEPVVDKEGKPVYETEVKQAQEVKAKPMVDKDGKPMVDADGKPMYEAEIVPKVDKEGKPVYDVKTKPKMRSYRGTPAKALDKAWNGVKSGAKNVSDLALESMSAKRLDDSSNSTTDSTDNSGKENTPNENHENRSQNKSFDEKFDKSSISKNEKSGNIFSEAFDYIKDSKVGKFVNAAFSNSHNKKLGMAGSLVGLYSASQVLSTDAEAQSVPEGVKKSFNEMLNRDGIGDTHTIKSMSDFKDIQDAANNAKSFDNDTTSPSVSNDEMGIVNQATLGLNALQAGLGESQNNYLTLCEVYFIALCKVGRGVSSQNNYLTLCEVYLFILFVLTIVILISLKITTSLCVRYI